MTIDVSRPCTGSGYPWRMPDQPRVVIVMPAYNAARTLERTYADIPHDLVGHVILVDDLSKDETVDVARQLGLEVIVTARTGATAATRRRATTGRSSGAPTSW